MPVAAIDNSHDIFAAIRAADILVHHPYDSFEDSVEHFIAAAAADPETVGVKMTAYRIGDDTPFVKSLVKAAENGKQVACVIEIKARFDEERNLHWAAELERAGAHVTFGVQGLKTHAKCALVVRKELSGLRSYVHIGTGNYHARTARLYADFGLFTCDPRITRDVVSLFHYLTGHSRTPAYSELLVAPAAMRQRLLDLIRREIANQKSDMPARIVAKMNQLEDPEMIEALCEASAAGVPVDLIVRGFCCLRPGVPRPHGEFASSIDHRTFSGAFAHFPFRRRARRSRRRVTSSSDPPTGCTGTYPNAWRWSRRSSLKELKIAYGSSWIFVCGTSARLGFSERMERIRNCTPLRQPMDPTLLVHMPR